MHQKRSFLITMFVLAAALAAPVSAQDGIKWMTDPKQAIELAKKHNRPLMVYVLSGTSDRDDNMERDQRRALSDPAVHKAARHFVPLRLSRGQHRDILPSLGLSPSALLVMSFVTPDGKPIDTLSPDGVSRKDSLEQKLVLVWQAYGTQLLTNDIKPVLTNKESKPEDVSRALGLVDDFEIKDADVVLIEMLGRESLDDGARKKLYDILAKLSTKAGVDKLVELAQSGDARALEVLPKCAPSAAETIVAQITPDAEPFPYPLYDAVTKICKIRDAKPAKWWENAKAKQKSDEIDRVKKIVEDRMKKERGQRP